MITQPKDLLHHISRIRNGNTRFNDLRGIDVFYTTGAWKIDRHTGNQHEFQ
jgi:hypothetical protein